MTTNQTRSKEMEGYAKQEALAFQHFLEFKMKDEDWMNEDDTLKTLDDVWGMYLKSKNDKH